MTPRVAVAAVVVVLALAASFHFVVAETGVADQCSPVDVLHPNRAALCQLEFLKFKFLVFFRFFGQEQHGLASATSPFSFLYFFLIIFA